MQLAHILPHVTASLNALTAVLLLLAYGFIRTDRRAAHRFTMLCAVASSALFLVCYLVYHFTAPIFVFPGQGLIRSAYYTLLISHVALSLVMLPMILVTVRRGLGGQPERHRALARFTFPIWLYVSFSGIAVYVMLYHVYPQVAA